MTKKVLDKKAVKKAFELMSKQHQDMYKKVLTHTVTYVVKKNVYQAIADHLNDTLEIKLSDVVIWSGNIDEYTKFDGNMEMFVKTKVKGVTCH